MFRRALCFSIALAGIGSPVFAQDAEIDLCHFDNPAPFVADISAIRERSEVVEPVICVEPVKSSEAPEELLLPMPCGHNMYFRRVDILVRDLLDHQIIYIGDANAAERGTANKVSSMPRATSLSGGFYYSEEGTEAGRTSYYYIAKYETTEAQWHLFEEKIFEQELSESASSSSDLCIAHRKWVRDTFQPVNMLPAHGITWFEALAFSSAYTSWLLRLDAELLEGHSGIEPLLPWREGSSGYIRLPTDAEWEYAARGGAGYATREALSHTLYQIQKDGELVDPELRQIAQLEGLRPGVFVSGVGKRAPNALGLYDVLGNAEELLLNLFQPTRPDGLKGQVGGAVVRGGSTQTSENLIGLGYRQETHLYSDLGENHSAATGARFVISAPYFVEGFDEGQPYVHGLANEQLYLDIETAIGSLGGDASAIEDRQSSPMDEFIERANAANLDAGTRALINEARSIVEQSQAIQIQEKRTALTERFVSAASLAIGIDRTGMTVKAAIDPLYSILQPGELDEQGRKNVEEKLPYFIERISTFNNETEALFSTYIEIVSAIIDASEADRNISQEQATNRIVPLNAPQLVKSLSRVIAHVREAADGSGGISSRLGDRWLDEVDNSRQDRITKFEYIKAAMEK